MVNVVIKREPVSFAAALRELEKQSVWIAWDERVTLSDLARRAGKQSGDVLDIVERALAGEAPDGAVAAKSDD